MRIQGSFEFETIAIRIERQFPLQGSEDLEGMGTGTQGFSLEANLMMEVKPSSRSSSAMGLPG